MMCYFCSLRWVVNNPQNTSYRKICNSGLNGIKQLTYICIAKLYSTVSDFKGKKWRTTILGGYANKMKPELFFFFFCLRFSREKPRDAVKGSMSQCLSTAPVQGTPGPKAGDLLPENQEGTCSEHSEVRGRSCQNVALGSGDIAALPNENVTKARQKRLSKRRSQVRMMLMRRSRQAHFKWRERTQWHRTKRPSLKGLELCSVIGGGRKVDQTACFPGDSFSVVPLKTSRERSPCQDLQQCRTPP